MIIGISLGITYFAPIAEIYKGLAALPAVGALVAALFQLIRDDAVHHRNKEIQEERHLFNLGATSHMANTVFDKHVEFSEKYLKEVHELVTTLTREGPTQSVLKHTDNLYSLRINYTAWITQEIEHELEPFEQAIRRIGANAYLARAYSGEDKSEGARQRAVATMYDIFNQVMYIGESEAKDEDATIEAIKEKIRKILRVNELVGIREYLIQKATNISKI